MNSSFIVSPVYKSCNLRCRALLLRNHCAFGSNVSGSVNRQCTQFWRAPQRRVLRCGLTAADSGRSTLPSPKVREESSRRFSDQEIASETPLVTLLYDGECPICMKEVRFLQSRDAGRGRIAFVDITSPDYDPAKYAGITFEQAMGRIHGILPDGTVVKKVDVFRACYEAVGLGWLWAVTSVPLVKKLANAVYDFWADRRLQWTGRGTLESVLAARRGAAPAADGDDCSERCVIDWGEDEEPEEKK
jgi:predicted DCC family thiol-disulfide oxidoreductase YuxK